MRTWGGLLAAVLLTSSGGAVLAQPSDESVVRSEPGPCPPQVVSGFDEVEGETVSCGVVTVPADYDQPDGPTIDLAYGILKSTSLAPAPDPVIYLHGGPGAGELGALTQRLSDRFSAMRDRRDIVVFDQRGAGFSPAEVDCSPTYEAEIDATYAAVEAELESDAFDPAVRGQVDRTMLRLCAEALAEQGVDLTQYNTINNARDVASVAAALRFEEYNLYALSYGTKLGLETIRQQPAGLRAVILDSVNPASIPAYELRPQIRELAFGNIYDLCLDDDACAAAYPDLTERLDALLGRLEETPLVLESGIEFSSEDLIRTISDAPNATYGTAWVPYLPRLIDELEDDVTETLTYIQSGAAEQTEQAARYRAPTEDVPFDIGRLFEQANELAKQSEALDRSAEALAEQALGLAAEADTTPAGRFLRTLDERRETPIDTFAEKGYKSDLVSLPLQDASQAVLAAFVDAHFQGADAAILLDIVATMSEDDIAEAYRLIRANERVTNELFERSFGLHLFVCNEDVPYNTIEGLEARSADLAIPALAQREIESVVSTIEACEDFPTGTAPDGFHDVVTGDGSVPVLVLTGTNDIQTASDWGEQVASELIGAQHVDFPNAGHGVIGFSRCAQDISAAFMDDPNASVDSSCTEGLVPRFVLPDEPLAAR